ncbi:MAG TPA: xanthine dehydrogenase family protein subunit M [Chloroflexota bacterium]|nr:xanthine dehydrogenase family protein subunit M [Chloroflexota bacterium]
MIPSAFEYAAPQSLAEAISFLQGHAGQAKVLAGGQSLIPLMKFRLASPEYLVDIARVPGLAHLEERAGHLAIGSMVREAVLEASPLIRARYPALLETSLVVADPLVRNFATVGGNVAHADPANDHPATMLALRAHAVVEGPGGRRTIAIDDFLVDTFETALAPDEVLVELQVPQPAAHSGSAYVKLERKVGDYAIAGVAVQVTLEGDVCHEAGLGLTNVGSKAIRPLEAERFLVGKRLDEDVLRQAADLAATAAEPVSDLRGPAEYKRAMVRTLTVRALRKAAQRAKEA